ncbi:MAG: outer membrane beta-barrel protein [Rhizobiales bacterium]|nr:outer membrane beta-barrel protein [Hyphomicrobiales bacterium]
MQRLPLLRSAAPRGLLVAACVALGGGDAVAQMAAPDPLTPRLSTDPRNPPRFQQFSRPALAQLGPPLAFTPPASGAGDTGFDSTNTRKAKGKGMPKSKSKAPSDVRAIAPGAAAPATVSPYQKPVTNSGSGAYAAAPGSPPVELGPIQRPPKKRKARVEPDDPYAPLGLRTGAFTLYPAIELIGGYDSNPARAAGAKGATLTTVVPELRAQSNWSRHELKGELRGSYTGYSPDTSPTLSRPYLNGKADGRVDVSKLTRIDLGTRVTVSTDNPNSPNLQAGLAKLPMFATFGGSAGIGQKFNRFDLSLKGDAERTVYQQSTLTDGSTAGNAFRNYNQYGAILRGGYELLPGVTPFVEVGTDARRHDLPIDPFGFQRNSKGVTGKLGSTFDLRGTLTGEIALGYTQRSYEDPRLDKLAGLMGNASLIWAANALTTVKLSANSNVGESTIAGVSGVLYRDVGLQIDHSFRRWLIGSVKLGFGLDDYVGMSREDKRFSAGVGLAYKLNRSAQIKGEFRRDWLRSNVTGADYTASVFLLGLRLQR